MTTPDDDESWCRNEDPLPPEFLVVQADASDDGSEES